MVNEVYIQLYGTLTESHFHYGSFTVVLQALEG